MWIKNTTENENKLYINLKDINLNKMEFKSIKVLLVNSSYVDKLITASNGYINGKKLFLNDIQEFNFTTNSLEESKSFQINC